MLLNFGFCVYLGFKAFPFYWVFPMGVSHLLGYYGFRHQHIKMVSERHGQNVFITNILSFYTFGTITVSIGYGIGWIFS